MSVTCLQQREAKITTRCPSCGHQTIMVTPSGDLVCSLIGCKDPTAIHRQSAQRCETCRHYSGDGACQHPVIQYLNDHEGLGRETLVPETVNGQPFGCTAHQPKDDQPKEQV